MDSLKENIRAVLNFSPSERRGLLVLILIILLTSVFPRFYKVFYTEEILIEIQEFTALTDSISNERSTKNQLESSDVLLFNFDPNTCSEEDLMNLGFPDYLAGRLIKFRNSGGNFKKREDLLKLYGMNQSLYNKISPFVNIKSLPSNNSSSEKHKRRESVIVVLDVNTCDSIDLIKLKGIGPTFSQRIIKYRESLGGFHSKEQLMEVYGINDSLFKEIDEFLMINDKGCEKIDINNVQLKELRKHPYFRNYNLSRAIINYRSQHNSFQRPEDLLNIHIVNDSIYKKIAPYINVIN